MTDLVICLRPKYYWWFMDKRRRCWVIGADVYERTWCLHLQRPNYLYPFHLHYLTLRRWRSYDTQKRRKLPTQRHGEASHKILLPVNHHSTTVIFFDARNTKTAAAVLILNLFFIFLSVSRTVSTSLRLSAESGQERTDRQTDRQTLKHLENCFCQICIWSHLT